jgi:hypothetical protein
MPHVCQAPARAGESPRLPIIGYLLGHTHAATRHRHAYLDADPIRRAVETIGATITGACRYSAANGAKGGALNPAFAGRNHVSYGLKDVERVMNITFHHFSFKNKYYIIEYLGLPDNE